MKTILISAGLALALSAAPAWAEDFHCPKPGTVIVLSDVTLTFADQEGMVCVSRNATGGIVRKLLGFASTDSAFAKNHGERLYPFKVGNEIEYDHSADSSHLTLSAPTGNETVFYHSNAKVVREERLVTKMGTYDTYVIEIHQVIKNKNISGAWLYSFWFAPDLGYIVKETHETRGGYGENKSWEITSLTLPTTASPPVATSTPPATVPLATIAPTAGPAPVAKVAPAPTPAPPPANPQASSVADRLQTLKDLLDRKVITPEEYTAKRKEILKAL